MNRKFAGVVGTLAVALSMLSLASVATAQGVADNRTDSTIAAAATGTAQAIPVEHRVYYQDYRLEDGLQLPFKFRRAIGPDTTEETTLDRYRINVRIDPKKFNADK